jgi:hypothetical protein
LVFRDQGDKEIIDHGGLLFLVEVDDPGLFEAFQGHVDHPHGPVDDLPPGGDNRVGLLASQTWAISGA